MKLYKLGSALFAAVVALTLNACSSGDGSGTSVGILQFQPASNVLVTKGSVRTIDLQLVGSAGMVGKNVDITVSDTSVASVAPGQCALSSAAPKCTITITGKALGSFTVTAAGAGYASAQANGQVQNAPVWGEISLKGAANNALSITYNDKEAGPYAIQLTATLNNSSGVVSGSNVYAYANTISGLTFPAGQQCQLTTENNTCTLVGQFQGSATTVATSVVPSPSASGSVNYPLVPNTTTVNLVPSSVGPTPSGTRGTVSIDSQSSTSAFYAGHSGPLFAVWTNGTGGDTYQVTLTSSSPYLQFYGYQPGNTSNHAYPRSLSQQSNGGNQWVTQDCQLNLGGQQTGCGFNLYADPNTPAGTNVNISCSITNLTNPSGEVPMCATLPVTVMPLPTDANGAVIGRTLVFTNSLQTDVTIGVTSGTVSSYTGPTSTSGVPANSARKAGKVIATNAACGLSSASPNVSQTACPIGASCMQGGQAPSADVTSTPFYCYFDNPIASNSNYTVGRGGQTLTLTIPKVFGSTASTQQIQWSGNFYAYGADCTSCQASQTPGTGPNVAAVTLGEATFQHNTNDYYDVSIINGLNYAVEFGPTQDMTPGATANAYACGTAGGKTAMAGTFASNPYGYLPASTWAFTVPAPYYRLVQGTGSVQGYALSSALTGTATFNPSTYTTGSLYGIVTSDQLWGWNSSSTNYWATNAPFNYQTVVNPSDSATFNYGDLFLCDNNAWTSYQLGSGGPISQNCGGVNWGAGTNADGSGTFSSSVGAQITRPNQGYKWTNTAWTSTVLQTIQWLKEGCPTCYVFPFDDPSSTFQCDSAGQFQPANAQNYLFKISNITTN